MPEHHVLILGCGYLGQRVAQRHVDAGDVVHGSIRNTKHAALLVDQGVRVMLVDLNQPLTLAAIKPALQAPSLDVYYLVPPGRPSATHDPQRVIQSTLPDLVRQLARANLRRAVLASSTAVFGDQAGQTVTADSPINPQSPRAQLLQDAETHWLAGGERFRVVRLAGLYGPGRIPGLQAVSQQAPLLGDPDAWLNLVHVEDAAALLQAVAASDTAARVELASDGQPLRRLAYYTHLAQRVHLPAPEVMAPAQAGITLGLNAQRLARSTSKSLNPRPTQQRTGWTPQHPDALAAIDALLDHSTSNSRPSPE